VNRRRSLRRAEQLVAHLRETFAQVRALDITADRISAYTAGRLEAGAAPGTVNRELAALKRALRLGERAGKVARCPHIPLLRENNVRKGFFEEAGLVAVMAHLPAELQPVIEFAYLTGWRIGEILGLQWRHVDFEAGTIRLDPGTTKNDDGRTFPFSALTPLRSLLQRQRQSTTEVERARGELTPWVFHRQGRPVKSFRTAWKNACREAGLPGRLVHDLRRSAVRNLERSGVPRSLAMKLTGHKTESVYRRYAIVCEADLSDGVERLGDYLSGRDRRAPRRSRGSRHGVKPG
jgi:integrase